MSKTWSCCILQIERRGTCFLLLASSVAFENSNFEVDFSNVDLNLKSLLSQLTQFFYQSKQILLKWPFFQEKVVVIECKFFKNSNTKCKILKDDYSRNSNNRQQGLYIIFLRVIWQWVWTKPKYFMVMGLKLKLVIVLHTSQENGMCHQYLNLLRMRFTFLT